MSKRNERFRGGRTHGRGKKGGRGKGKRGGSGLAGGHKHRFMEFNKYRPDHFGMHGFKRPQSTVSSNEVINVSTLDLTIEKMVVDGAAKKSGKKFSIDLKEIGFDKLLGNGNINKAITIKVSQASKSAIEKIEAAGGKVELE